VKIVWLFGRSIIFLPLAVLHSLTFSVARTPIHYSVHCLSSSVFVCCHSSPPLTRGPGQFHSSPPHLKIFLCVGGSTSVCPRFPLLLRRTSSGCDILHGGGDHIKVTASSTKLQRSHRLSLQSIRPITRRIFVNLSNFERGKLYCTSPQAGFSAAHRAASSKFTSLCSNTVLLDWARAIADRAKINTWLGAVCGGAIQQPSRCYRRSSGRR
jgi:hypothetical protein